MRSAGKKALPSVTEDSLGARKDNSRPSGLHSKLTQMRLRFWPRAANPLTYRRLGTQIKAVAERLNQLGIGRGDRRQSCCPTDLKWPSPSWALARQPRVRH